MASSRLTKAAYDAAKKVADANGESAVNYISRIVLSQARADLAALVSDLKGAAEDELKEIKAKRKAKIADLEKFLKTGG